MKNIANNKIIYNNVYGRVAQHELLLNQGVQDTDSPTFANLSITNDCVVNGNLYVYGNTSVFNTTVAEFEDNIIELNSLETSNGVTLKQAGLEINRGSGDPYRIVFDESSGSTKIGFAGYLKDVLAIGGTLVNNGILTWDTASAECLATDTIKIPVFFSNTQDSISSTTGSIVVVGGVGVSKNINIDGSVVFHNVGNTGSNSIYGNSNGNLVVDAKRTIIPTTSSINFGNTTKSLMCSNGSLYVNWNPTKGSDTVFYGDVRTKYNLHLSDSTSQRCKMYSSESAGITAVNIDTDRVVLPSDTRLVFGAFAQRIQTNINNDLLLYSSNDIYLNSNSVFLPYNSAIVTGINNRIYSDNLDTLHIISQNGIYFDTNAVNFSRGTSVYFGDSVLKGNTSGSIELPNTSSMLINGTMTVRSQLHAHGGICVSNTSESNITYIEENTAGSFTIRNSNGNIMTINGNVSNFSGILGANYGSFGNIAVSNGINELKTTSGNIVCSYALNVSNTSESTDFSTGSLIVDGGLVVKKTIRATSASLYGCDMNFNKITRVADPQDEYDCVNKRYVDIMKLGLEVKQSVRVATLTDGNITSAYIAGMTVDNVVLSAGDRILIKDQLIPLNNGIYTVQTAGSPLRATDLPTGTHASANFVFVREGSVNSKTGYICMSQYGSDITDTNDIIFTEFTGLGDVDAGDALGKSGNTIYVKVDNASMEINNDALRVASGICGTGLTGGSGMPLSTLSDQSHVTKIGIVESGTWGASVIKCAFGGSGTDTSQFSSGNMLTWVGNSLNTSESKFVSSNMFYSCGNIGIGTTVPSGILDVYNQTNSKITFGVSSNNCVIDVYGSSASIISGTPLVVQGMTLGNESNISIGSVIADTVIVSQNIAVSAGCDILGGITTDNIIVSQGAIITNLTAENILSDNIELSAYGVRYGISGTTNENIVLNVLNTSGNTVESVSIDTSGSVVFSQNITVDESVVINGTSDAVIVSDPASFISEGGCIVKKNLVVGTDAYVNGDMHCMEGLTYDGNGFFKNISNTSGSTQWWYLGQAQVSSMYLYETINNNTSCLELYTNNTTVSHAYTNSAMIRYIDCSVYENLIGTKFIFLQLDPDSVVQIHSVGSQTPISILCEGNGLYPNGEFSLFDYDYTKIYSTLSEGTVSKSYGDVITSSLENTGRFTTLNYLGTHNQDAGIAIQRYQVDNDIDIGDIITDTPTDNILVGSVVGINNLQIRFGTGASIIDDFYNGWWMKLTSGSGSGQTRQIIGYNGAQKVATFRTALTTLPAELDNISLFSRSMYGIYYNETSGTLDFSFIPNISEIPVETQGNIRLRAGQFTALNASGESVISYGDVKVYSTSGSSLIVDGSASARDVKVGDTVFINGTNGSNILIGGSMPSLVFSNTTANFILGMSGETLQISDNSTNISLFDGCVSINTTQTSNNTVLLSSSASVACEGTDNLLRLGDINASTGLDLYGDESTVNSAIVLRSSGGSLSLNKNGIFDITNSVYSSATSASVLCSGGITILNTTNSVNVSNGGALTVNGGTSILKDVYIGGSLYVSNDITSNNVIKPNLTSSGATNCSVLTFDNTTLLKFGDERVLSFNISVAPTAGSALCEFTFSISDIVDNFTSRKNIVVFCSGYEDVNLIPLFNVLCVADVGTKDCLVKFQSVNTSSHELNVIARYNINQV